MDLIKNLGRGEVSTASAITKRIYQIYRYLTNFNFPGKSKKNIEHHYDIGGDRGEKLYDIFLDTKHRLILVLIGKKIQKHLKKHNKIKLIIL